MHETRGSDNPIGGIAVKIQRFDRTADMNANLAADTRFTVRSSGLTTHMTPHKCYIVGERTNWSRHFFAIATAVDGEEHADSATEPNKNY